MDELRTHPAATSLVYALFFGTPGLLMKVAASAVPGTVQPQATAYLCAAAVAGAMMIHLLVALKDEVEDNVDLTLVLGTMLLQFTLSVVMLDFAAQKGWSGALPVLALPHGLCPMILSVIMGRKIGLFGAIYSTLLGDILFMAVNQITYIACSALIGFPFAMGVITGLVVGGGMPVIEAVFRVTTEVTWL